MMSNIAACKQSSDSLEKLFQWPDSAFLFLSNLLLLFHYVSKLSKVDKQILGLIMMKSLSDLFFHLISLVLTDALTRFSPFLSLPHHPGQIHKANHRKHIAKMTDRQWEFLSYVRQPRRVNCDCSSLSQ